jgi:predicted HAD superfamily phosphohydrolase YqeG
VKSLATGNSAFSTFFQTLPRLASVVKRMRPTWHLDSLAQVDAAFLKQHGIKGMIWDVDGTLTGDRKKKIDKRADAAFHALIGNPRLKHVILSNAGEERYVELGSILPEIPILRAYRMDGKVLRRRRLGHYDTWTPQEVEHKLAEGAAVIRKPSGELVAYALDELGLGKKDVVMVGDQYMTDVAGANMGGVRSIKLPTIARETFRTSVRFSQRLELAIYAVLYGRAEPAQ